MEALLAHQGQQHQQHHQNQQHPHIPAGISTWMIQQTVVTSL